MLHKIERPIIINTARVWLTFRRDYSDYSLLYLLMPHILVVDDDPDLLELVTLVLKRSQYQVTALQDGTKVFPTIAEIKPDVILMDIYLGNADGRIICKELKSDDKFNTIPVILYSAGNITSQSITDAMADSFIVKPFNNTEILDKIQELQPG